MASRARLLTVPVMPRRLLAAWHPMLRVPSEGCWRELVA